MSIFSVAYNTVWQQLTAPDLRENPDNEAFIKKHDAWGAALTKPLQYLHNLVFEDYIGGSSYSGWTTATTYTTGQRVIYNNRRVYEALQGSTNVQPTVSTSWREINRNYIGATERVKYSAQKLTYEYALNRWFQTSGIYIQNTPIISNAFMLANSSLYSMTISSASTTSATTVNYISSGFTGLSQTCYTIYVPAATYTSLASTNTERESIVRSFANTVNLAGMTFNILSY